jgi:hypothetical protein
LRALAHPRVFAALALTATSLVVRGASAQAADSQKLANAQTLFAAAQAAMDKKDWATACPKLEEVTRLLPNGVGGHLTLAQCYEGAGRLASAWTEYLVAQSTAAQAIRAEQEKQARDRGDALKPKLAQLTINVPESARGLPGLVVERDGVGVGAALWSTPIPVDRGRHVIVASATGRARWEKAVEVGADGVQIAVDVDLGAAAPSVTPVPAPKGVDAPALPPRVAPGAPPPPPAGFWTGLRIGGVVAGGVGLVGLGVGAAFGATALSKKSASNADGHCVVNKCDATGSADRASGLSAATVSTAMFVAGGVVLAGGITMIAVGGPAKSKGPEAALRIGPGSVDMVGVW